MLRLHASAVAFDGRGVLIQGASGSGKSSLALQLMRFGAVLVADDQTELYVQGRALWARAPASIAGLIEARGIGLLNAPFQPSTICAVVNMDTPETERLPEPRTLRLLDIELPLLRKVDNPAWPAALAQYLTCGRSKPE